MSGEKCSCSGLRYAQQPREGLGPLPGSSSAWHPVCGLPLPQGPTSLDGGALVGFYGARSCLLHTTVSITCWVPTRRPHGPFFPPLFEEVFSSGVSPGDRNRLTVTSIPFVAVFTESFVDGWLLCCSHREASPASPLLNQFDVTFFFQFSFLVDFESCLDSPPLKQRPSSLPPFWRLLFLA